MDAWIISGLLGIFLGFISAIVFRGIKDKKGISTAKDKANVIISAASQKAENIKKEKILEAKERVLSSNLILSSNWMKESKRLKTRRIKSEKTEITLQRSC